ncbi:MAG TPA: hypothetical protein VF699_09010 [Caulobacteraceae bacterium]|jgi:hypothetical protein
MSKLLKTMAAAAALLTVAPAAVAQPYGRVDLARYDATRARSLSEQLVLCDLAAYFGTGPNLSAHRVYLNRDKTWFEPTFPLAITRGSTWYDEDLEDAYRRHRAAGRVSGEEIYELRRQYGSEMERAFQRTSLNERQFFQRQSRFCRDLARASWS